MNPEQHLGIARMEASTWHRPKRERRPRRPLPRRVWWAVAGRVAIAAVASGVLTGVATFGVHEPGRSYVEQIRIQAFEPETGRPVPRAEYVSRALEAGAGLASAEPGGAELG